MWIYNCYRFAAMHALRFWIALVILCVQKTEVQFEFFETWSRFKSYGLLKLTRYYGMHKCDVNKRVFILMIIIILFVEKSGD